MGLEAAVSLTNLVGRSPLFWMADALAYGVAGLIVLVTGGTSGIGLACVRALRAAGACVAFTGRRAELGASIAAELGGCSWDGHIHSSSTAEGTRAAAAPLPSLFVVGDVTSRPDRDQVVAATVAYYGRIDVLFNNAGIVTKGSTLETSDEDWDSVMRINLTAAFQMTKAVLPHMLSRRSGNIINCASDWGLVGARDYVAYCVSKAGLVQLTRCVALEHARDGIRCNAICPGDTHVERWETSGYAVGSAPVSKEAIAADGADLPLGRVARTEEVAAAVVFLASREPRAMTGAMLPVDGGNTAQ